MPRVLSYFLIVAIVAALIIAMTLFRHTEVDVNIFKDVTSNSGLTYTGMTHGTAWGDFDNDGLPDLYVTNHLKGAKLFRNLGQGRFTDLTDTMFESQRLSDDKHGAAWGDFNNDGRPDLVQLTGAGRGVGAEPKRLYLNQDTKFEDVAEAVGVSNPQGRTRMPLWYDFNRDGQLDLFQGAESRFDQLEPPFIFLQQDGKFTPSKDAVKFASRSPVFCIITALEKNTDTDLVCRVSGKNRTSQIFDTSTLPARELELLPTTAFEDIAAADFDNDGNIDLFLARKNPPKSVAFGRPGNKELIADIHILPKDNDKPAGFTFSSSGQLQLQVASAWPHSALTPDHIYLGNQGSHPDDLTFTLSSDNDSFEGLASSAPGKLAAVYIGKISADKWEIRVTAPNTALTGGKSTYQQTQFKIVSSEAITDLETIGDPASDEASPARLFMNRGGKLVEESEKRGVNNRIVSGMNVVAADFDNDMDVDVFVLASGTIGKHENLLLLNRGDGHFDVVAKAGGAAGSRSGVGDSVTSADFDNDGFLDLLITTGGSMGRSLGTPSDDGAYHLYRNVANDNHWLEIDLEGTTSNRDGIGAVVHVTTNGITQVRVQDGGMHNNGQNHQRLHFGLAKNTQIETIKVYWPSGTVQMLDNVSTDQMLRIKEPAKE